MMLFDSDKVMIYSCFPTCQGLILNLLLNYLFLIDRIKAIDYCQ